MKPPNLIELLEEKDRDKNTDIITHQANELLKDILALVERARDTNNSQSSPNRCTRAQVSIICLAINSLGNEVFELLRTTKVEEQQS